MKKLEAFVGEHIQDFAKRLLETKKESPIDLQGRVNDVVLTVTDSSTFNSLMTDFERRASIKTDRLIHQEQKEEAGDLLIQLEVNHLVNTLENLDFTSYGELLKWLSELQPYSNKRTIVVPIDRIVGKFEDHGFHEDENVGEKFNSSDKVNFARYIIGQCLVGLKGVGAIHPTVINFYKDWKEKFPE